MTQDLGAISGRFHPFHREHLDYARAALERCGVLLVGITNADPSHVAADPAGGGRHRAESNPFTYHERAEMIHLALEDAGVAPGRYRVVPCPLQRPELLPHYLPREAVHWVTLYDEEPWGARKLELLRGAGYRAEVLWQRPTKGITATRIRQRLRRGEPLDGLVAPPVARYLESIPDLAARLGP